MSISDHLNFKALESNEVQIVKDMANRKQKEINIRIQNQNVVLIAYGAF